MGADLLPGHLADAIRIVHREQKAIEYAQDEAVNAL